MWFYYRLAGVSKVAAKGLAWSCLDMALGHALPYEPMQPDQAAPDDTDRQSPCAATL